MGKPRTRVTIPASYPLLGYISIPKKAVREKSPNDPLLNIIRKPEVEGYTATTWQLDAYKNTFDKFQYGIAKKFACGGTRAYAFC